MIARLLALFAVLALALSPVNAAAAAGACAHMSDGGEVGVMPQASAEAVDVMPCCDPHPSSTMDPACVATCVAMAGVVADLPQVFAVKPLALARTPFVAARSRALPNRPPPRLERPPRPIA